MRRETINHNGNDIHMDVFGINRTVIRCSNWGRLKRAFKAGLLFRDPRGKFFLGAAANKSVQVAALDAQIRTAMLRVGLLLALFI